MTTRFLSCLIVLVFAFSLTDPLTAAQPPQLPISQVAARPTQAVVNQALRTGPVMFTQNVVQVAAGAPDAEIATVLASATQIVAGMGHTCALTTGGGVKCWGYNSSGQVGDGTMWNTRAIPVDVSGLASGAQALVAGWAHTCALTTGGGVKCWGWNGRGQLGDGTTTDRATPVDVSGLTSGVTAIAAGADQTCALMTGGGVKCWGYNFYGQLGNGTTTDSATPVDVSGLASGVSAIDAGWNHTCALMTGGGVKCWGDNNSGQLGDGTTTNRAAPVDVSGMTSGVQAIAAGGYHTCALTTGGGVKCWGSQAYGQLGDGMGNDSATPVAVSGLASGVTAIAAGGDHTCALTTGGVAKCWGANRYGQLGDGTLTNRATPVDVGGLASEVLGLAAGGEHTCALTAGGWVRCWGWNTYGQLGDGTTIDRRSPVSGILALAAGDEHTCALTTGGGVQCWGANDYGQLGDGTTTPRATPVDVSGLASGILTITAGGEHTCALTTGGGVKCWGHNVRGPLGVNPGWTPVDVVGFGGPVTYSMSGRASDGDGNAIVGASVSAGIAGATTTDSNGAYSITGLVTGTYTLTPGKGGYLFTPPSRTVTVPPNASGLDFVATPAVPVVTAVAPTSPATITLPSDWGAVKLPASLVTTTTTTFTYTQAAAPVENTGGFAFAGRSFTLDATDANGQPINTFNSSFTITLNYQDSEWQAAGIPVEENLNLYFWNGTAWTPVLPCAGCSLDTINNRLTAVLNHLTEFAMLGNPRTAPAISSSQLSNSIELRWTQTQAGIVRYEVYRSTGPYVAPGAAGSQRVGGDVAAPGLGLQATMTDSAPFDAPPTNYYYVVLAVGVGDEKSPASNRVGVFSFGLTPGAP